MRSDFVESTRSTPAFSAAVFASRRHLEPSVEDLETLRAALPLLGDECEDSCRAAMDCICQVSGAEGNTLAGTPGGVAGGGVHCVFSSSFFFG